MSESLLVENLLKWLRTFETASNVHFVSEIADGLVLGNVLSTISPKHFTPEWLTELYRNESQNWTAKANNLRQILQAVTDFLTEVPDERISIYPEPDLVAIAKDNDHLAAIHLLQLVLGCAVNCENKEKYIEAIMGMEESVQQSLMEAIQQVNESSMSVLNLSPLLLYWTIGR
ncbi:Hook 3 [Fasciola gigantica]|uniref:Hook 3 n=1 Tax=Fasciola gigantica TaxID=46835 RepID=A0A504YXL2_FASGI|nr:Hook 3 [Fasciola gigantica]